MKQQTLSGFDKYGKTTRRAQFLADMDQIIPWPELAAAVQTVYPKISENGGRPPFPLERMLRIYFLHALDGLSWEASVAKVLTLVRAWPASEGTVTAIENAVKAAADGVASRERVSALGEGWVGEEALAVGLYCAMVSPTFAECIELAANHDGDSDSTASVAGQLWGARCGLGRIPREAVERLDVIDALVEVWEAWEESLENY